MAGLSVEFDASIQFIVARAHYVINAVTLFRESVYTLNCCDIKIMANFSK